MNLLASTKDIGFLTTSFPEMKFMLFDTGSVGSISCFVCWVDNENLLSYRWSHVASLIAIDYQSVLEDESAVWNIYLCFICPFQVNKSLKYEIENNKFSMRKIVVDAPVFDNTSDIIQYLNNEILGHDLEMSVADLVDQDTDESYKSDLQIQIEKLGEIPFGSKQEYSELRLKQIKNLIGGMIQNENKES